MLGCILFSSMQMVALLGQESSELTESQIAAATPEQLQGLAETGDARAQFSLGLAYFNGRVVSKDLRKASIWFEKAAEQGHLSAQYNLGVLFVQGFGVDKDFAQAAKWFRKAADQGDLTSQYNMGIFFRNGLGVPLDPSESLRYFASAASQGDPRAQFHLGQSILEGDSIEQNLPEAYLWIKLSAAQGNKDARALLDELTPTMSPEDVFQGRLLNAERGDAEDQFQVAMGYTTGHGIKTNASEAIRWLRLAAGQDHPEAQLKLGQA